MPRQRAIAQQLTAARGLLTEANDLNFPDNYFDAGDNIEVDQDGKVSRRFAIGGEEGFFFSDTLNKADSVTRRFQMFQWENPATDNSQVWRVLRVGSLLHFYDIKDNTTTKKSFTYNLTSNLVAGALTAALDTMYISADADNEILYIVGEQLEPFYLEYDADTDSIIDSRITIEVRDFEDADPNTGNDIELPALTPAQDYDLKNRGWVSPGQGEADPKDTYFNAKAVFPPKSKAPWVGLDSNNSFSANLLSRVFAGNSSSGLGKYILNLFRKDRTAASGIAGLDVEIEEARPTVVGFFAGRPWFIFKNQVLFNQTVQSDQDIGKCYQDNDPTAEELSDLLDSDGGIFPIQEMSVGRAAAQLGTSFIILGDNGVWAVSGSDGIFKATSFSVNKITSDGITSAESLIQFPGGIAYWAESGINIITIDSVSQQPVAQNVSEEAIATFYNTIPASAKARVQGTYDRYRKELVWTYKDTIDPEPRHQNRNKILKFRLTTQAFVPQSVSDSGDSPVVPLIFSSEDPIFVSDYTTSLKALVLTEDVGGVQWTFGEFNDRSFLDFSDFGTGVDYTSFIEPGHRTFGDTMTFKQAPYITCFFERTEDNFVEVDTNEYAFDFPSSCILTGQWEWSDSMNSGRITRPIQVYAFNRNYIVDTGDLTFDYGQDVIVTKRKLRGRGLSLKLRFESETGKDFRMLGWSMIVNRDSNI